MGRRKEFEEHVTLYHGSGGPGRPAVDPQTFLSEGISVGRANPHEGGVVWATTAPTHDPAHWVHGSGWGEEYKQPSWSHVVEFRLPRSEFERLEPEKLGRGHANVRIPRTIAPEEITTIHDIHALHGPRIKRAQELEQQRWAEFDKPKKRKR